MSRNQRKILEYYKSLESKLGYKYITWESKHFGYYPDGKSNIPEQKAQELMKDLVAKRLALKSSDLVLDAGCGYGIVACYLSNKYNASIIGLDINGYEIDKANKRAIKMQIDKKVKFKVMSYLKTAFTNNYFNAAYTLETLSHATNLKLALKELLRVIKPGGKIALFEYTLAPEKSFSKRELQMLNLGIEGTAASALKEFKHDQFKTYLEKIGFKHIKEEDITKNFLPSLYRLKKIARIPYFFIKMFNLQKYFINSTIAVEWYDLAKKGLLRYCIFTAQKSSS